MGDEDIDVYRRRMIFKIHFCHDIDKVIHLLSFRQSPLVIYIIKGLFYIK